MIDKNLSEWLFYQNKYRWTIGKDELDDPKWIELHFPNEQKFCNQIIESNLDEFVRIIIWSFKDRYPIEFSSLESSMWGPDENGIPTNENINTRKLQDILPIKTEEDDYGGIKYVKIQFKNQRSEIFKWIETELEDKNYVKDLSETTTYSVNDSPIERIEASSTGFTIFVNQDKVIH